MAATALGKGELSLSRDNLVRAFVAIPLGAAAIQELARLSRQLAVDTAGSVRWVRPENYHVTLKFLGEIPPGVVQDVKTALEAVSWRWESGFMLELRGVGAFPSPDRPRVLWAGTHGQDPLRKLHHHVDEALEALGFAREKRFVGHITLGRKGGSDPSPGVERSLRRHREWVGPVVSVDRFVLMESRLGPGGPTYLELASYQPALSGRADRGIL